MSPARLLEKLEAFIAFTDRLALLSTCNRAGCGAIVVPADLSEVYSIGYNGQPCGLPNQGCTGEQGECGCVHAEANAALKLSWHPGELVMLSSTLPCWRCAGLIINKRIIRRVVHWFDYRDDRGRELLEVAGIPVIRYQELTDDNVCEWWPHSTGPLGAP